ncbi:MAG TPA: 3-dehydroquinate synthase [Patescibacteria group bacterium]|nr:3-dehydroquinate synthase [Patescibacteria group bacterium]
MIYTLENNPKGIKTQIVIGADALAGLNELAHGYTKIALIADENSARFCSDEVKKHLRPRETIILPAGEDTKNLQATEGVLRQLREAGCDRKSLIIGLGGGMINDLSGFTASIYMRGIDWVMLPTTLTAQADASIGGKTGVNLDGYKNMVGSFWPPKAVLINPGFLSTLPEQHIKNGLAEIIKMGFIYDKNILEHIEKIDPKNILGRALDEASSLSAQAKIGIVNADMYESGERKLLNFGHTVGHALESISLRTDRPLLHGEAISIGMVAEAKLAELEEICEKGLSSRIATLLQKFNLPVSYDKADKDDVLELISSDKKNVGKNINWTLPKTPQRGLHDHVAALGNIENCLDTIFS